MYSVGINEMYFWGECTGLVHFDSLSGVPQIQFPFYRKLYYKFQNYLSLETNIHQIGL